MTSAPQRCRHPASPGSPKSWTSTDVSVKQARARALTSYAEAAATARFAGLAQSTAGNDQDGAQPPFLGKRVKFADGPLLSSSDGHPLHEGQLAAPAPSCKSTDDADDEESCMPEALTPSSILAMERELGDDFQSANAHSLVRLKRRCAVDVLSSGAQRQA